MADNIRLGNGGMGFFPAIYQSALAQNAEDYDSIMSQYKNLGDSVRNNPSGSYGQKVSYNPIAPQFSEYAPGSDYSYLRDFADTGGYSDSDVSNLRARAVAPIRSIYASAQRDLDRKRNLAGGYSPNYNAATAKMARESSNLISGASTNANAAIAEMVQRGKLAGATSLAPLEAQEAARKQSVNNLNASTANEVAMRNAGLELETARHNKDVEDTDFNKILESIKGQQSTFGTTPAMLSTVGNQTLAAGNLVNNFAPIKRNRINSGVSSGVGLRPNSNLMFAGAARG